MARRGHRALPHTADVRLEAWGADVAACCEEALAALIATFVDAPPAKTVEVRRAQIPAGPEEAQLLAALEELIFISDTAERVPVRARVQHAPGDRLALAFELAERSEVHGTGAVPKAISRSGLRVESRPGRVSARFLVDL